MYGVYNPDGSFKTAPPTVGLSGVYTAEGAFAVTPVPEPEPDPE